MLTLVIRPIVFAHFYGLLFMTLVLGAPTSTAQSLSYAHKSPPFSLSALQLTSLQTVAGELDKSTLAEDLKKALEQMHGDSTPVQVQSPPAVVKLESIRSVLQTQARGFHYLKSEAISSSTNVFHIFYRHKDEKLGKAYVESVLALLKDSPFVAFPQKVTDRTAFSTDSPVVLAFNFLTNEEPYPQEKETLVSASIRSPFGFHNDVRGVPSDDGSASVQLQEYFIPAFQILHWEPVTPAQVAEAIKINNSFASSETLYASVSQSFGTTMAYLELYLKVSVAEYLSSARKLLSTLAESQKLSRENLSQDFCPAPTDYFIMASDLRPTFHTLSGRSMAFVSHDFNSELYSKWLILSQLFNLSTKPLLIEDCGWPTNITDDFKRTVQTWWKQMSTIGNDQKTFQQTKFLCDP